MNNMILNIKIGRNTSIHFVIAKSDIFGHIILNNILVVVIVVQTNILILFLVICMNKDIWVSLCSWQIFKKIFHWVELQEKYNSKYWNMKILFKIFLFLVIRSVIFGTHPNWIIY